MWMLFERLGDGIHATVSIHRKLRKKFVIGSEYEAGPGPPIGQGLTALYERRRPIHALMLIGARFYGDAMGPPASVAKQ
jgi:hypothetical protein